MHGEDMRLEPPTVEMAPTLRRWFADLQVTRYMDNLFPGSDRMNAEWLERTAEDDSCVYWAITRDGAPVGMTWIKEIDWRNRRGVTGIAIGEKDAWGGGVASEAMRLRGEFAFQELNLHKLLSEVMAENGASIRALEKAGYQQYGLARSHDYSGGRWHDTWMGELLRDRWESGRSPEEG
jgi:RimJ/RimL family protein N-acetyltransferase